jgi:hypothetical protein
MVKRIPLKDGLYVKIDSAFNCQLEYKVYTLLREKLFVVLWDEIRDQLERNVRISLKNRA